MDDSFACFDLRGLEMASTVDIEDVSAPGTPCGEPTVDSITPALPELGETGLMGAASEPIPASQPNSVQEGYTEGRAGEGRVIQPEPADTYTPQGPDAVELAWGVAAVLVMLVMGLGHA